jgi:hypothetical protein
VPDLLQPSYPPPEPLTTRVKQFSDEAIRGRIGEGRLRGSTPGKGRIDARSIDDFLQIISISKHIHHAVKNPSSHGKALHILPVHPPCIPIAFAIADEKGVAVTLFAARGISANPTQFPR